MSSISVIIITFNEERNIGATVDAAWKVADEVIVCDSGSTDGTREACIERGARFIYQPWLGFGEQRNAAVALASHPHILVLDADEVVDEALAESILEEKAKGLPATVYSVQRRNYYYGRFILHGMESRDVKPRLYHRDHARWNDKLVHEDLEYADTIKACRLKGYLLHYTYRQLSEHVTKTNRYSSLAATEYYKQGNPEPGFVKLVLSPAFTFINAYFIKAGFLDGWHGWVLAKMHAHAVLQKYAKLKMIYYSKSNRSKDE